jgi:hypothetical protein
MTQTRNSALSMSGEHKIFGSDHACVPLRIVGSYAHKMSEKNRVDLRAESPALRDDWVAAIKTQIEALRLPVDHVDFASTAGSAEDAVALQRKRDFAGKSVCADCGAKDMKWASLTHLVLICDDCCGAHR